MLVFRGFFVGRQQWKTVGFVSRFDPALSDRWASFATTPRNRSARSGGGEPQERVDLALLEQVPGSVSCQR